MKIKKTALKRLWRLARKFAQARFETINAKSLHEAVMNGLNISKKILSQVDDFLNEDTDRAVLVVTVASLTAVLIGGKMVLAGGLMLKISSLAAATAFATLRPELAIFSLIAAELGLHAIVIGGFAVVCGAIALARMVGRLWNWCCSKIKFWGTAIIQTLSPERYDVK